MLFYGCRHPDQYYLYRSALEDFAVNGVVDLHPVFSRQHKSRIYLQDFIRQQRDAVWSFLQQGGMSTSVVTAVGWSLTCAEP